MNPWMNDPNSVPNSHAGFGPSPDASMSFLQPAQTINPAQFQTQSFLNGANRTSSSAFHNSVYQPNPVIPLKRAREDSLGTSPRQASNAPSGSRSQTPGHGGPYPGFNPQANGGHHFSNTPTPFQHLQTSNNATPSPTIQQIGFNQQQNQQRVATASPSPFSPQHNVPQASPAPSDHVSRVGTPHDNPQNFMQNPAFGPNFNPPQFQAGMNGQMGMGPMSMAQPSMPQSTIHPAQRMYQMQMQAQARQIAANQARNVNGMPSSLPQSTPNPQPVQNESSAPPVPRPSAGPEDFFRGLQTFSVAKGRPVDLNPMVCGRPIQVARLYMAIFKMGGSQRISKLNQWPLVAHAMGFPAPQQPQAAAELQTYWMSNMGMYEQMWLSQQRRVAAQHQTQAPTQHQASPSRDGPPGQSMANHQRTSSDLGQMKLNGQLPQQAQPGLNGFAPPVKEQPEAERTPQHKPNLSRQFETPDLNGLSVQGSPQKPTLGASVKIEPEKEHGMPPKKPLEDPFRPEILSPSRYHGPVILDDVFDIGSDVVRLKPVVPSIRELGVIDIHALTMAIKSGIHAETRLALDTLVTLSTEATLQLNLGDCEDLVETLLEAAQLQVEFLSDNATEVSDEITLPSYEELIRACRTEADSLQEVPEFGSLEYDLERAVDRLICITTLIRNFSFYESNFDALKQPEVLQLFTTVIRHVGTKDVPLRTSRNTLDFFKDAVVFLSNLSTVMALPGKQEALCVLHLLLAFAPTPQPVSATSERVCFTAYSPTIHKYLPAAVDSLAKLLARDEPNRIYYRAIFAADANSTPQYELLTKTFGLAISPIPAASSPLRTLIEARKPFLLQGLLAAELLAGLAPGSENSLARSWIESEDGFVGALLRIISLLSSQPAVRLPPQPTGRNAPPIEPDGSAHMALTHRAMAVLKLLVHKSRTFDKLGNAVLPSNVVLKKETLLGAMIQKDIDPGVLRQLCAYSGLDE